MDNTPYSHLELSTQNLIATAKKRGVTVQVIDPVSNTIRLERDGHSEMVMQATRTAKDSYMAPLLMANKHVTKWLLAEAQIRTPEGLQVTSREEGKALFEKVAGKQIVVKPLSTNFGVGITMLTEAFDRKTFDEAMDLAFSKDSTVLIEAYVPGKEYRFLIIDGKVIGVLHRVPANVVGDGAHSIQWLIHEKNKDPLRGEGYVKPLEKIRMTALEALYLKEQGKDFQTVPEVGETVYLRKNSNISTGGDSIDFTDEMAQGYKDKALASAKALGAKVCGVDMIVQDIHGYDPEGYSIIELNYNPAIHIHNAPYKGKNRHAEAAVLDMLGFPER